MSTKVISLACLACPLLLGWGPAASSHEVQARRRRRAPLHLNVENVKELMGRLGGNLEDKKDLKTQLGDLEGARIEYSELEKMVYSFESMQGRVAPGPGRVQADQESADDFLATVHHQGQFGRKPTRKEWEDLMQATSNRRAGGLERSQWIRTSEPFGRAHILVEKVKELFDKGWLAGSREDLLTFKKKLGELEGIGSRFWIWYWELEKLVYSFRYSSQRQSAALTSEIEELERGLAEKKEKLEESKEKVMKLVMSFKPFFAEVKRLAVR